MNRFEAIQLILGERDYQNKKWGEIDQHPHPLEAWVMYIDQYVGEAKKALTYATDETLRNEAKAAIRKIGALALAAIENHGAPPRE